MSKKILFINQEIKPYVPDSDMSVMGYTLPQKMQEKGYEIRTFMPKWGNINERRGQLHEVIRLSGLNIGINDADHQLIIKVASIPVSRIQVYFIDNDEYFSKRHTTADKQGNEYDDNGERAIFFARGVLETVKKLRWVPDYIVCQGWMASVVPFYLKTVFKDEPCFADVKVVSCIFEKQSDKSLSHSYNTGIPFGDATPDLLASYKDEFDFVEVGKFMADYSDAIIEGCDHTNAEVVEYAKSKNIPVLAYSGESGDAYKELLESL